MEKIKKPKRNSTKQKREVVLRDYKNDLKKPIDLPFEDFIFGKSFVAIKTGIHIFRTGHKRFRFDFTMNCSHHRSGCNSRICIKLKIQANTLEERIKLNCSNAILMEDHDQNAYFFPISLIVQV